MSRDGGGDHCSKKKQKRLLFSFIFFAVQKSGCCRDEVGALSLSFFGIKNKRIRKKNTHSSRYSQDTIHRMYCIYTVCQQDGNN